LGTLASLPRVVLAEAVDTEVGAAHSVCELVAGAGPEKSLTSAWLSLFALCFRNGSQCTMHVLTSSE
jgi:hypothetical protein